MGKVTESDIEKTIGTLKKLAERIEQDPQFARLATAQLERASLEQLLKATGQQKKRKGLTPGLLSGVITYVAEDFDDELPDSFWLGEED